MFFIFWRTRLSMRIYPRGRHFSGRSLPHPPGIPPSVFVSVSLSSSVTSLWDLSLSRNVLPFYSNGQGSLPAPFLTVTLLPSRPLHFSFGSPGLFFFSRPPPVGDKSSSGLLVSFWTVCHPPFSVETPVIQSVDGTLLLSVDMSTNVVLTVTCEHPFHPSTPPGEPLPFRFTVINQY